MLYSELPFVTRAGISLLNFKHKNQYLWNCSCPICGDMNSEGTKRKARFYIYRPANANQLNCKCHKCGYSASFRSFLKLNFPDLYKEMVVSNYKKDEYVYTPNVEKVKEPELLVDSVLDSLKQCSKLNDSHTVAKFLLKRSIPRNKWHLLYYTVKFKEYCNSLIPGKFENTNDDHPRLIIPYFDSFGRVHTLQGRSFGNEEPKYITIKLKDTDRIYGLERLDPSKTIYAVEGPIDSLFLPNCIAVSGSNFDCDTIRSIKSVVTLVPDNEPRSRDITKLIKKHITLGYKVCMLPHSIKTKDINEHVQSGISPEQLVDIINQYTFQGAAALAHFSQWTLFENEYLLS